MDKIIKYCDVNYGKDKSFSFDHVHIIGNEQIAFHQHPAWELSYIVKGSGTRFIGDTIETFSSGEVILVPPNIPHCWSFDEFDHDDEGKIENLTIIFTDDLLERCNYTFPETEPYIAQIKNYKNAMSFEGKAANALREELTAMVRQNEIERLSSLIKLFYVLSCANNTKTVGFSIKQNKDTARMQEVIRFILNNYHQEINLDSITNYIGMNKASFCIFFKKLKGKTFFSYLNEYRIECSCLMLRETTLPIAEICYAVGFNDVPHYNRTFKKLKGETPKDYRKKYQFQASGNRILLNSKSFPDANELILA